MNYTEKLPTKSTSKSIGYRCTETDFWYRRVRGHYEHECQRVWVSQCAFIGFFIVIFVIIAHQRIVVNVTEIPSLRFDKQLSIICTINRY